MGQRGTPPPAVLNNSPLAPTFELGRFPASGWKAPAMDAVVLLIVHYARSQKVESWDDVRFTDEELTAYGEKHAAELPAPYSELWSAETHKWAMTALGSAGYVVKVGITYVPGDRFKREIRNVFLGI